MRKSLKKVVGLCLSAVMLAGLFGTTVSARKADIGENVFGEKGWSGSAVMAVDPVQSENKVLKLENGSAAWKLTNLMGTEVSYSGDILVSADFYASNNAELIFQTGGAEVKVAGSGKWDTVSVLVYTAFGKYEMFVNDEYSSEGTFEQSAYPSVSGMKFTTDALFYIDNIKVEQFDRTYADEELEAIFSDNFDSLNDGALYGQNGWSGNTRPNYGTVTSATAYSGKAVDFTRTDFAYTQRNLHDFTATADNMVVSMMLYHPSNTSGKLDIKLRAGAGDSGSIGPYLFVENQRLYSYKNQKAYQNVLKQDEWFELKLILNTAEQNYNIYVDGRKLNETPIQYYASVEKLGAITFEMLGPNSGSWYMDNLNIYQAKKTVQKYTTIFEDDFNSGFDVQAKDGTADTKWRYGTRNTGNPANAAYGVANAVDVGQIATDSPVLEINAKKHNKDDQNPDEKDTTIRDEAIVANLGGIYDKNVRITADIYAANYFYETGSESPRRDNLRISLANNYNYNNGNSQPAINYFHLQGGNISVKGGNSTAATAVRTYNQNQWNSIEIDIDSESKITVASGGVFGTVNTEILSEPMTDLVIYVPYLQGGWWYLDNVKVQTYETVELKTDVNNGKRTLLIENTIDEMYNRNKDAHDFTVEGMYYTRDGGGSVEAAPRDDIEYKLDSVVLRKNATAGNAMVIAAVYEDDVITQTAAYAVDSSVTVGETVKISCLEDNFVCKIDTDIRLFVWNKETLTPLTDAYKTPAEGRTKLFVAAASLSAPYGLEQYPMNGWGEALGNYLWQQDIEVVNVGAGGRSSKSYYNENGKWNRIMEEASAGDFVLCSFAHNDSKEDEEHFTNPYGNEADEGAYKYWLKKYMDDCAAKGINLIYVAPLPRRVWQNGQLQSDTVLPYVEAMREFTAEHNMPFVDLYRSGFETVADMGEEASKAMYMVFDPADYQDDPYFAESEYNTRDEEGNFIPVEDNTHLRAFGADKVAGAIAAGLNRIDSIRDFVK